mgnify:CR=1 FL=1
MVKLYSSVNRSWMELNYPDPFQPQTIEALRLDADNVYANASYRDIWREKWAVFIGGAYTHNRDRVESGFGNDERQQSGQMRFTMARSLSEKLKLKFGGEYLQGVFDEHFRDSGNQRFHTLRRERYSAAFAETDL